MTVCKEKGPSQAVFYFILEVLKYKTKYPSVGLTIEHMRSVLVSPLYPQFEAPKPGSYRATCGHWKED